MEKGKEHRPFESQSSEWTPLLSTLLLREEPRYNIYIHTHTTSVMTAT